MGKRGFLGRWKNYSVCGIKREEYERLEEPEKDVIYALFDDDSVEYTLVKNGYHYGKMSFSFHITENSMPVLYNKKAKGISATDLINKVHKMKEAENTKNKKEKSKEKSKVEKKKEIKQKSVDEILRMAVEDEWYKELMYEG